MARRKKPKVVTKTERCMSEGGARNMMEYLKKRGMTITGLKVPKGAKDVWYVITYEETVH